MKIKSRFTKIAVASGLILASGAGVLGIAGSASAQVAQRHNGVAVSEQSDTTMPTAAQKKNKGNRPSPLATVAKAMGITTAELKIELQSGKSIADVATAKNIDLAKVKAALIAKATAHVAAEVAKGKITATEAAAKLASKTSGIDTMLTTAGLPARGPEGKESNGPKKDGRGRFMTDALAKVLNVTTEQLRTQLHSGKSLADVAKTQNIDIANVKTALVADFSAHLAKEVTSGKYTQAEADAKLVKFKTDLDNMVNRVGPSGGRAGQKSMRLK